jgi:hypothetical protein
MNKNMQSKPNFRNAKNECNFSSNNQLPLTSYYLPLCKTNPIYGEPVEPTKPILSAVALAKADSKGSIAVRYKQLLN